MDALAARQHRKTDKTKVGKLREDIESGLPHIAEVEDPVGIKVDLGVRYVFAAGDSPVTLRLTVDNVFDKAFRVSSFDAFTPALLQGAPRTARASASIAF